MLVYRLGYLDCYSVVEHLAIVRTVQKRAGSFLFVATLARPISKGSKTSKAFKKHGQTEDKTASNVQLV
jgi:hypothetical protein